MKKNGINKYLLILIGCLLMAIAYKCIYDPASMVTGGFTGISIIVKELWGVPLWATNAVLNIPVFLAAYKIKGKSFVKASVFGTIALTVILAVLPEVYFMQDDFLLTAIFGGVICGCGISLVLMGLGTTGGTDMLAAIIQKYLKHYSVSQIMQVLDGVIVIAGAYFFGIERALYAVITIYIITIVSDGVLNGMKYAKAIFIISDSHQQIGEEIMEKLDRGVTGLYAYGMYSQQDKRMLFCIVSKKEAVEVKEIVKRIDPRAFMLVSDVREALGEGFSSI